jgi:hypothetical protein
VVHTTRGCIVVIVARVLSRAQSRGCARLQACINCWSLSSKPTSESHNVCCSRRDIHRHHHRQCTSFPSCGQGVYRKDSLTLIMLSRHQVRASCRPALSPIAGVHRQTSTRPACFRSHSALWSAI